MNYFNEYKKSKFTLLKLLCQFYDIRYTKKEAEELGLNFDDRDKPNDLDSIHFIYHSYTPDGLYIWKKLGLKKPIYSIHEIWNIMDELKKEEKKNIDYYRESLILKLTCLNIVMKFYKCSINIDSAKKNKIRYNSVDKYDDMIEGCDHYFEGAGEAVWNLFRIKGNFKPMSTFKKIEERYQNKLLKLDIK